MASPGDSPGEMSPLGGPRGSKIIDFLKKIIQILEEYIKPAVEQDGGAIQFESFEKGTVKVSLQGACSGCPSSMITLKSGIEKLLKRFVPEVEEVVAEGV